MDISRVAKEGYIRAAPRAHGGALRDNIIDFSASINPLGPSKRVYKAIRDNLHLIVRYPDPSSTELKKDISSYLNVNEDNIIIGNGSTEIIHLFANIFVKVMDKVIIPGPTFYEYEFACDKNSALIEFVDLDLNMIDLKDTKAVFLCNPNNPSGLLYDHSLLMKVIDEAYNNSTLVMLDECFIEFVDDPLKHSLTKYVNEYDNLAILRSFTKAFGLAGLRIGYTIASKELASIMNKVKIPWNVSALAQIAAREALNDLKHIEKSKRIIKREKSYLINSINRLGFKAYNSDVNFFLVRCEDSVALKNSLLKHDILVRDCSNFTNMSNDHIRISARKRNDNKMLIDVLEMIND